jgi:hypothetical protein
MVNATMAQHNENIKPLYEQHAVQLTDRQVDHKKYLPPMLELRPVDANYVNTSSGRTDPAGRAPAGAAAAPAATEAGAAKPPPTAEEKARLRGELTGAQ